MTCFCQHFFARAGFTENENRGIEIGNAFCLVDSLLHGWRLRNQLVKAAGIMLLKHSNLLTQTHF